MIEIKEFSIWSGEWVKTSVDIDSLNRFGKIVYETRLIKYKQQKRRTAKFYKYGRSLIMVIE